MQGVSSVWGHALFCSANKIFWRELMKKGSKAGYVLQMICGIGMLLFGIGIVIIRYFYWQILLLFGFSVLYIVFAVLGRKRVWPNVVNLILSLFPLWLLGTNLGSSISWMIHAEDAAYIVRWSEYLRVLLYALPFVFILLGFIGSIVGIENVSKQKKAEKAENAGESAASSAAPASESPAAEQPAASLPPLKAKLLRKREGTVVRFRNESGEELVLDLVDAVYFKENGSMQLYAVLQKEGEEQFHVAQYHEESDTMSLIDGETADRVLAEWQKELVDTVYLKENGQMQLYAILRQAGKEKYEVVKYRKEDDTMLPTDPETAERVLAEWQKGAASPQQNGAVQRASGRLKLDLYDTIVHKADWKAFRKRASQDELFALAVGSRYQLDGAKPFVKTFLAVVGVILAIVIMVSMEFGQFGIIAGVAVILACNLVVCKQLGYYNTLSDCRWKLDREHLQLLKDIFPENIIVSILRWLFMVLLTFITLPYKFLLFIIETFIPAARNWTVAHGGEAGAVISMPKGCDIGGLGAMGAYYASQKFGDVWDQHLQEVEAAKLAKFQKYTYTDQYGMTQEAYSDDGKTFYEGTNKLKEVGTSEDGGKTIDLK